MANKRTNNSTKAAKSAKSSGSSSRVTRITASDSTSSKPASKTTTDKPKRTFSLRHKPAGKPSQAIILADTAAEPSTKNPLRALGRYFKGAWYELNQVRWPDRPTTWQMTGALLAFTAFFVLLIILLDSAFKYLFEFILG